jgi:3-methylcrotonyl-CoA carboxylase alpha subunit
VEFLLDPRGRFYFMEMNTRLQVEHPVTEMITGQDLVAWQLVVAGGDALPLRQEELSINGAAMEVRIYAEDPSHEFLPSSGRLTMADWPRHLARVDSGFEQGDSVSDHYDPMIAKIITHGPDRETARRRLCQALRETRLSGPRHNIAFLVQVLESDDFSAARLDTRLLEHQPALMELSPPPSGLLLGAAVLALSEADNARMDADPWSRLRGWRALGESRFSIRLGLEGQAHLVARVSRGDRQWLEINGESRDFSWQPGERIHSLRLGDHSCRSTAAINKDRVTLFIDGQPYFLDLDPSAELLAEEAAADRPFAAPMSGTVVTHHVEAGGRVASGDAVITMEAMKMEHTLRAPAAGKVLALPFAAGDTVTEGQILAEFEAEDCDE